MKAETSRWPGGWAARVALLLLLALGVYLRVEGLGSTPLFGDEHHSLKTAAELPGVILTSFDRVGSHVLTPLLQHGARALFGPEVWTLRLVALVPGVLTLLLLALLAWRLAGVGAGLVATALLATSPMHVFYSRFGRPYALEVLLALLLVMAVLRLSREERSLSPWNGVVLLVGALTLYVHLSSAGLVAGVGAAYLAHVWLARKSWRAMLVPLGTFGLVGLVALLLYLPIWGPLQEYLGRERSSDERGPLSWLEVTTLLGGGVAAGLAVVISAAAGVVLLARERRGEAMICAAALLGPLALLLVMRPFGMAYAYARYLITALPLLLLFAAVPVAHLLRGREALAAAAALLLAGAVLFSGPGSPRLERGTFQNTYLALRRLPAFDQAWPGASPFYAQLAQDEGVARIIELPLQRSRTVLLYRNHQRTHGKRVLIGVGAEGLGPLLEGAPYVHLDRPGWRERSGADWLVVHRRASQEIRRYWDFVYSQEPGGVDRGFMQRNERVIPNQRDAAALPPDLGPPDYQDGDLLAWRLTPGPG